MENFPLSVIGQTMQELKKLTSLVCAGGLTQNLRHSCNMRTHLAYSFHISEKVIEHIHI